MIMAAPNKPTIVIIGAGATGRGQLGQVAFSAGFAVTYIERRQDLVKCLHQAGRFTVGLAGETIERLEISDFRIYHIDEVEACAEAIVDADIITTAVIPTNLASTVPTLAAGLRLRRARGVEKPLNIIASENMERSSTTLRGYLQEGAPDLDWPWIVKHVGFPDAMIARAVPVPEDPLFLLAEYTQEWTVDATAVVDPMPRLEGMTLTSNQTAALERKLYIKNTGHMAIGILGFLKGYKLMDEAARDPEIFALVDAATRESAAAVTAQHGFDPAFIENYRASFLEAMKSPFLPDGIDRVIREPLRKLAREERLVGPAMLLCKHGGTPQALAEVIAAALCIDNPADPQAVEMQEKLTSANLVAAISRICGVDEQEPLVTLIYAAYRKRSSS
jgi:mannitol-1-phosphate 5-dehydrogenase